MMKKITRLSAGLLVLGAIFPLSTWAADTGSLIKADSLRAKPFADATVMSPLAAGAKVEIISRNGAWYQVKTTGKTGWVRMLSVRRAAASSGSAVGGLANVASGRTGTGKVTTTTGVRGLDDKALDTAAFNEEQIKKAEGFRVSQKDADAFAKVGKLVIRDVQPLPAPAKK